MLQTLIAHKVEIVTFLFFLSEALAVIPGVKSNSVFQLLMNGLAKAKDAVAPKSGDGA